MASVIPVRGGGRAAERLAAVAGRVTGRDRRLCALLAEHRVLTTPQLTQLAFPSPDAAIKRLAILHQLGLLDRFRPYHTPGSAPYHYTLGPLGAAVLAAHHDQDPTASGYRRDRTLALAHSRWLPIWSGSTGSSAPSPTPPAARKGRSWSVWWSEQRCAARWGRLVHPDGYGRWREHHQRVDFFLEYDRATEAPQRLAGKLTGYLELADATGIATPLLVWLPTPARETTIRHALAGTSLPIATATPNPDHSPAGPLWLPLHRSDPRRRLIELPGP